MPPANSPNIDVKAFLSHDLVSHWIRNTNATNSRLARQADLIDFIQSMRLRSMQDLKALRRSDIINWRDAMKGSKENPGLAVRSIKRKLSIISKFFEYLCDEGFVKTNIVLGIQRPKLTAHEGATQAISAGQAKDLLESPEAATLKGKRDRAILATFLFHALRRSELCQLKIKDILEREGIKQLKIHGKGDKERYIPLHPVAIRRINEYLEASGQQHAQDKESALFKSLSHNGKNSSKGLSPIAVYELVIYYGKKIGIDTLHFSPHSLRATAATNTLVNGEDIRKVQHWLGHASIQTTAMYDKRDHRPEDSPTYRVRY